MAQVVDKAEVAAATVLSKLGDIDLGNGSLDEVFANLTLLSLLFTSIRTSSVKTRSSFDSEYDYIVVGGGSAGCVMASRLSQHPCVKVLLLEAGGEEPVLASVPGFARAFFGTDVDWSYMTTPQKYSSFGQKQRKVVWNSGKVLGGGSAINAMLYVRGNKEVYDQWSRQGAKGWSYNEVLPYFLRLEDNQNLDKVDPGYHRCGGPLGVEMPKYNSTVKKHLENALLDMGYRMRDVNGEREFGIYDLQGTIRNQERCSTARAYLRPASERCNLHIVTKAFVKKVLFTKTGHGRSRASSVVFEHKQKEYTVSIRNSKCIRGGYGEIILSNGAVRTPQTLMLSGIGPKQHLEQFKIPVLADLPVGKNLMDHNAAILLFKYTPLSSNFVFSLASPVSIVEYALYRTGPLTSLSQVENLAFVDGLNNTSPKNDFPLQELYFGEYNPTDALRTLNLNHEVKKKVYSPLFLSNSIICASALLQPYSRGEVTLNSLNPHDFPNINPNYYADERDVKTAVEGMKVCKAVIKEKAMQDLKPEWAEAQRSGYPGCEDKKTEDDYLACIAKSVVMTSWHPSGTAKMGDPRDPTAVVDSQLRVIGVDNLRVVSAAIMPIITSGNTNAPTIMIAEKAYDMIKEPIKCCSTVTIRGSQQINVQN